MRTPGFMIARGVACIVALAGGGQALIGDDSPVTFEQESGRVMILIGGRPVATYVYVDKDIPRPYFAHVRVPGGIQVTRNHPPIQGKDPMDHATFHPGIWMAFGDVSGSDFWRNKARVVQERFEQEPSGGSGKGTFAVCNRYVSASGETVCTERCRLSIHVRPAGFLLIWDSTFCAGDTPIFFGDQEEMGLGLRVATGICVKSGGQILDSQGHVNEKQVRGSSADWCDYGGILDGRRIGVTLMTDPGNFRRSWYHARDYGALVANPFGRKALGQGELSRIVVEPGKPLRLRYGVLLHASAPDAATDLKAAYADFLSLIGGKTESNP